jgi:hypothetical protein
MQEGNVRTEELSVLTLASTISTLNMHCVVFGMGIGRKMSALKISTVSCLVDRNHQPEAKQRCVHILDILPCLKRRAPGANCIKKD